ncbi:MAG: pitrilysin family protein [Saprospiraceae bacterium]
MKKILFIVLSGLLFFQCSPKVTKETIKNETTTETFDFRSIAPSPKTAPEIKFGETKISTLPNGMKIIVVENNKIPKVNMRLYLDREPELEGSHSGSSELMGQMLNKGSKNRDKQTLDEEIDFLGADFYPNKKGFFISGLSKHADKLMELASDAVLNPTFPESEFDKIKAQTLSSLASEKDNPNSLSQNAVDFINYGLNNPYGEIITEETTNNTGINDIKESYNYYFNPANSYLVFVGDITENKAKELAKKYFGSWNSNNFISEDFPKVNIPKTTNVSFIPKRGAVQSVVTVTYPVDFKPNDPDYIKARVLNTVLGGYFRSRLNQNLREDHAYTYGIRSSLNDDENIGEFNTSCSVRNEVTDSAVYQIMYEIEKLKTEPIPQEELDLVKNVMIGNFSMALEKPQTLADFALKIEKDNLPKTFYKDYLKELQNLNSDDIMKAAQRFLHPDAANLIIVGDKSIAPKLEKFGTVTYYDPYGNKIENETETKAINADELFSKNIEAIGGKSKIESINSIETTYEAEIQGMKINTWELKTKDGKSANKVTMMGQTMQESVFNGEKGFQAAGGNKKDFGEEEITEAKKEALFPVLSLISKGINTVSSDVIDGKKYFTVIDKSSENTSIYYFDSETYLLDKNENIFVNGDKTQTITTSFSDYKSFDGVKIPENIVITGAMPIPMELKLKEAQINKDYDKSIFEF